ncbi:ADP-ribose pyrophosphatase [Salibacterium salarium]|uniref:NUDIX hydrolase n=1 Tax=Salibacterium salarium TaxID=284579 RepID=UPI0027832E57|nr:NUDIX hydrolase [Salibacterium salarium]MDQ0299535.1 ADP-ribose pyrophosphatase [Salibacterium salarium]
MDFNEKTLHKESIYEGKIVDVSVHDVELPDGKTSKREIINHPGAVAIIAVTNENKMVMVRQFRKALEKELLEIPAGKLEDNEDPLSSAARELEEETGYKTNKLTKVMSFYTSPGFADEIIHIYETEHLYEGVTYTDDDEFVELVEVTLEEAERLMKEEKIHDAKTVFAVQYVKQKFG